MKKTTRFKNMLLSGDLEFICEAHNGLSAKIVEEPDSKELGFGLPFPQPWVYVKIMKPPGRRS